MDRLKRLGVVLEEAAGFVEELAGEKFDPMPQLKEYELGSQTARDFDVTLPDVWITDVTSHTIHVPADSHGAQDTIQWHFDIHNLALETGQHLFIQKSGARRAVEDEVYGQRMEEIERRNEELINGAVSYYTAPEQTNSDYLLQLAIDDWAARGLSEGFGHLTAYAFVRRKIPDSPAMALFEGAFPIPRSLVDKTPLPDRYVSIQERMGTLYVAYLGSLYSRLGVKPAELFRRLIGIKREELPEIGARMRQLYVTSP